MNVQTLIARAAAAYARGDADAERICIEILSREPAQADATHLLGLVARQAGDLPRALSLLRTSVEQAPRNHEFRTNLGNLLRSSGRPAEAEAEYQRAVSLAPGYRMARLALARLLNDMGVAPRAEAEARALIRRDANDAEAWAALGVAQRAQDRLVEAEFSLRKATVLQPGYAAALHNLGALLGQLGRADESLPELDRAAALGVRGYELHFNRARALMELGRFDEADGALLAALRDAPTDRQAHAELAKLRYMCGDPRFLADLERAVIMTGSAELQLLLGDLYRRSGRLPEAEAVISNLIRAIGWSPALGSAYAVILQEQGRLNLAVVEALRAAAAAPDDAAIVENLVAILLQLGDAVKAQPLILQERRRSPLDQRWLAYEATAARLLHDPLYTELYDYRRFVRSFDVPPPPNYASIGAFNAELLPRLLERHSLRQHPLDQSLRFGTQTTRSLLGDPDPLIRAFLRQIELPLADYRRQLGYDARHPFTSRNQGEFRMAGCWSVRLYAGGHHVNHVHPEGWMSSAYYVEVPPESCDPNQHAGWITFGAPRMPVPGAGVAYMLQPRPGCLVLFPSYMWHGTTPIAGREPRTTIAFDVVPAGPPNGRT
ncbi:MAG TPA: putative 2OG-Fe(II) oxygenase [Steroidobacteraceae bacterium]|nr:putative 2OG-Fe(II) oxygenase [Steroidobacteraceae bacterium]